MTVAELIVELSKIDQSLDVMIFDDYRSFLMGGDVWIDKTADGVEHCYIA